MNKSTLCDRQHFMLTIQVFTIFTGVRALSEGQFFSALVWPQRYKTSFVLNSAEHEIFQLINLKLLTIAISFLLNVAEDEMFAANKNENANYWWHFHKEKRR